jgi:hypothetical protein
MNQLILEINRMREIMGVDMSIKPLIFEQGPGILAKIFGVGDNALKDVAENKKLIKQLDDLKPKGVKKLSTLEIDDLAELLSKQADEIAAAQASVGFSEALRFNSARKLNDLINLTARTERDSLLNLYIGKQLTKIFDDPKNFWNKAYLESLARIKQDFSDFVQFGDKIPEDELIALFKSDLGTTIKNTDPKFKWSEYPEYEDWARKKFLDLNGDLDLIIKDKKPYTIPSKNRYDKFKTNPDEKTLTDVADIKPIPFSNFRATIGVVKKIRNIFKKTAAVESFEKNVALLKGFPNEQIFRKVGEGFEVSPEFASLVRNVGFDIEQISTVQKNVLANWRELMEEVRLIDPKLVEGMTDTPIFKDSFSGFLWQEEKLNVFLERLSKRFEAASKDGGGVSGFIKEEIREVFSIVLLGKNSIIASTKNIENGVKGFWKGVANRKFFSGGIWTVPFSPKQIGIMITRRGFNLGPLLRSVLETAFALKLWTNVIGSIVLVIQTSVVAILEACNVNVTDDQRYPGDIFVDGLYNIWLDYTSYIEFPFKPGFIIDFISFLRRKAWEDPIDQTKKELETDRDKAFTELWSKLTENQQEKILVNLEVGETEFEYFSKITNPINVGRHYQFMKINDITVDDVKKLRKARVAMVSGGDKLGMTPEELKNLIDPTNVLDVEKYLKVGGVQDKDGNKYTITMINKNNPYVYNFVPEPLYTFYGVQPSSDGKSYNIYMDKSGIDKKTGKEIPPVYLTANDLKSFGINTGFDENGVFTVKDEAEKAKKTLKNNKSLEEQPPINIKELIKKL